MVNEIWCVELLGMPNAGKTGLGRRLDGALLHGRRLCFLGARPSVALDSGVSRSEYHVHSLSEMRRYILSMRRTGRLLVVDRGFLDKMVLYGCLEGWGIIDREVVEQCEKILIELEWSGVPRFVMMVSVDIVVMREVSLGREPYLRWQSLLGDPVRLRLEQLYTTYASLAAEQRTFLLDGTLGPETNYRKVVGIIEQYL